LVVEVIAYAPTQFYHCQHCEIVFKEYGIGDRIHREQRDSALTAELLEDYRALSQWAQALVERHCGHVVVKVIDAVSLEGFLTSLRYGIRRYPAVIIPGRPPIVSTDLAGAEQAIAQRLASVAI
jgi:hypothetical protein